MKILISGASKGLGRTLAQHFGSQENDLILIARSMNQLADLKQELEFPIDVQIISADLSQKAEREKCLNQIDIDSIDVLINNVGLYAEDNPSTLNLEQLDELLELNLKSAIELTQAVIPSFKKRKQGQIITINSVMGKTASAQAANYSISKYALKAWTDGLREELRPYQIKVCNLYPGAINTSSWDGIDVNRSQMIQKEDLANLIESILKMGPSTLVEEVVLSPLNFETN